VCWCDAGSHAAKGLFPLPARVLCASTTHTCTRRGDKPSLTSPNKGTHNRHSIGGAHWTDGGKRTQRLAHSERARTIKMPKSPEILPRSRVLCHLSIQFRNKSVRSAAMRVSGLMRSPNCCLFWVNNENNFSCAQAQRAERNLFGFRSRSLYTR
jgi:hypothetical protein